MKAIPAQFSILPVLSFKCKLHASHQIICLQYKKHLAIYIF